jgi:hypothetical protein
MKLKITHVNFKNLEWGFKVHPVIACALHQKQWLPFILARVQIKSHDIFGVFY